MAREFWYPKETPMKAILSRGIGALIAFGAGKLAVATGIVVDPATQASVSVFVYATVHKLIERVVDPKKFGL